MSIGLIIFLALIGIPLIEIAVFIEVGERIGLLATLGMIFATAAIGTMLIRFQGLSVIADARGTVERGELPVQALLDGVCLIVAGALLLTPGFVTDMAGTLLLITPVRRLLQGGALRWIAANGRFTATMRAKRPGRSGAGAGGTVIEGEFVEDDDDAPPPSAGDLPPR
ncbi:MAG: FxsA family protein [Alphaproteobacteria bacterium]